MIDEKKVRLTVRANLLYLMRKHGIKTQKVLAKKLEIGEAQLSHVMNCEQTPTLHFLMRVREVFDVPIEDFLFMHISQEVSTEIIVNADKLVYEGVYIGYYKNRDYGDFCCEDDGKGLRTVLLFIQNMTTNKSGYRVVALLGLNRIVAERIHKEISDLIRGNIYTNAYNYLQTMGSAKELYIGELHISGNHIFIPLSAQKSNRKALVMMYKPKTDVRRPYIGGMGTLSMESQDAEDTLVCKNIGVSRHVLSSNSEEIVENLTLEKSESVKFEDTYVIVENIMKMHSDEEIRKALISVQCNKLMNRCLMMNNDSEKTISPMKDQRWYKYIKSVSE